jgi:hypothetical protein
MTLPDLQAAITALLLIVRRLLLVLKTRKPRTRTTTGAF